MRKYIFFSINVAGKKMDLGENNLDAYYIQKTIQNGSQT